MALLRLKRSSGRNTPKTFIMIIISSKDFDSSFRKLTRQRPATYSFRDFFSVLVIISGIAGWFLSITGLGLIVLSQLDIMIKPIETLLNAFVLRSEGTTLLTNLQLFAGIACIMLGLFGF